MAKIDKVNPMCGCVMPVVPTIFSDGCLTLPEQVNKLTYKTNEVIDQTNQNTEYVNKAVENSETALKEARNAIDEIPVRVQDYLNENGSPRLNPGANIDGMPFDGTKNISHIAVCSSAIDANDKTANFVAGQTPDSLDNMMMLLVLLNGSNAVFGGTISIPAMDVTVPVVTDHANHIPKVPAGGWLLLAYHANKFKVVAASTPEYADEARKLADGNTINGTPFTGETAITIACTTTSAANSNEKIISPLSQSGVAPINGAVILVRFAAGNSATGAVTFKIGSASADAKQAYYNGSIQGLPELPSNASMLFVYANGSWLGSYIGTGGGSGEGYTLPPASATTLGGVKIGSGINVTADGTISAEGGGGSSYVLPAATPTTLGGVKVGNNLTVTQDGTLNAVASSYELPVATSNVLGGVKVGDGLSVTQDGKISVTAGSSYELPVAGVDSLGGVKIRAASYLPSIKIDSGYIDVKWGSASGFTATSDGIAVKEASNGAIEVNTLGVNVKVKSDGCVGIASNGNGLYVKISGSGGIINPNGELAVNVGDGLTNDNGTIKNAYTFAYDASTATLNITGP
nr:MAG TPA: Head fiber protein [Caudoviricetes sp.]